MTIIEDQFTTTPIVHERPESEFHAGRDLPLSDADPEIYCAIRGEEDRQHDNIELIASENVVSRAVREAQGSVLTNKYAEGYPGKRWYGGCENVDVVESLAIERVKKIFGAGFANVQPHSGASANIAVFSAILEHGDAFLGMRLDQGGHLTHGHPANFSGKTYNVHFYGVDETSNRIDYDELARIARDVKPKLITTGASAYPRVIDFAKMRGIADEVGAMLMADIAHIAGLIAAGEHPSPFPHAHIVTTTTHKTLRGPRGGVIMTDDPKLAKKIDSAVFPGTQGGPLMHVIAAKAVAFHEALQPSFRQYQRQIRLNAAALADELVKLGFKLVTGGTDNHLMLVDLRPMGLTGKLAQYELDQVHITTNKNTIPYDTESPFVTSGLRLGSPASTSRGFREGEMRTVATLLHQTLANIGNAATYADIRRGVKALCDRFPA